jgi:diacylglycerol kinase family enzyme
VSGLLGSSLFRDNHLSQAKHVNLGLREPQELMIDGEIFPEIVSVRIQILPMALECVHGGMASWSARF